MNSNWIGIDYGSQLAGTTVIAHGEHNKIVFYQSVKRKSADEFIIDTIKTKIPFIDTLYIDAPLSLPAAYFNRGKDFMYRNADRELSAMSPMFLGGLTARAMRLAQELKELKISSYETYPAQVEKVILGQSTPKKVNPDVRAITTLFESAQLSLPAIRNRHQYDALWAWWAGYRHKNQVAKLIGDPNEGIIVI